jgi:hypothetical protein
MVVLLREAISRNGDAGHHPRPFPRPVIHRRHTVTIIESRPEATASQPVGTAQTTAERRDVFDSIIARLSKQSVDKHFEAYRDVPWDEDGFAIDPEDPRWELWKGDALRTTSWFESQPMEVRSRIGLHRTAAAMRFGAQFENILQRGLLAYCFHLPNNAVEYRYLHHEVIEESQHSLMFQEFVNRTGLKVSGFSVVERRLIESIVIPLNRVFPELFFLFVLGGEDPVDHLQRMQLRAGVPHPLLEKIMRIHVTEEARHISYARNYLKTEVPRMGTVRKAGLALFAPVLYGAMTRIMVDPPRQLRKQYGVPAAVLREAKRSPEHKATLAGAAAKPRKLCEDLGLVNRWTRPLWNAFGLTSTGGSEA